METPKTLSIIVIDEITNEPLKEIGWKSGDSVERHWSPSAHSTFRKSDESKLEVYGHPKWAQIAIDDCGRNFVGVTFKVVTYALATS